jgi:gamma-glutamyl:cysteine ligase YbdK (ATP-grasp superfamily)
MKALGLFEGYGIEIELMIVDAKTLCVRPLAERLLQDATGQVENERSLDGVRISNELAAHVIEFKTDGPVREFSGLMEPFRLAVDHVQARLAPLGARLLGTGMHPFMDPFREAVLWPYGQREIYRAYDRIFDCRGHGWVNLQSVHLNLPFCGAEEFGRLHGAIRCVLPLIPALCASTPMADGRLTGLSDTRLSVYRHNQARVPEIAGHIIPEAVFGPQAYANEILEPMYKAIAPLDPSGILHGEWLNSRGAIARFDRSAIEIRLVDTQEAVEMDLAVIALVAAAVRGFVEERLASFETQKKAETQTLAALLHEAIARGEDAQITSPSLLKLYGLSSPVQAGDLWKIWYEKLAGHCPELGFDKGLVEERLTGGTLASRIRKALGENPGPERIFKVYALLAHCQSTGKPFEGKGLQGDF